MYLNVINGKERLAAFVETWSQKTLNSKFPFSIILITMSRPVIKFPPHHIQIEETLSEKENDLISVYSQPFHKSNPINSPPPPTLPPITTDEIFARHTQDTRHTPQNRKLGNGPVQQCSSLDSSEEWPTKVKLPIKRAVTKSQTSSSDCSLFLENHPSVCLIVK